MQAGGKNKFFQCHSVVDDMIMRKNSYTGVSLFTLINLRLVSCYFSRSVALIKSFGQTKEISNQTKVPTIQLRSIVTSIQVYQIDGVVKVIKLASYLKILIVQVIEMFERAFFISTISFGIPAIFKGILTTPWRKQVLYNLEL